MSSNIQIKRVCVHCGQLFLAKTTVTKYCTHRCNQRAYKQALTKRNILQSNLETKTTILNTGDPVNEIPAHGEFINAKQLAAIISVSESTVFRLIRDEEFPKVKLGRRLVFNKEIVVDFINHKYGSI